MEKMVDLGRKFMATAMKEMEKHKTNIRCGCTEIYWDQAIVKRFNCTLCWAHVQTPVCCWDVAARRPKVFWMSSRLPAVVSAQNGKVTRLTVKKPIEAIKEKALYSHPSTPCHRPVDIHWKWLPSDVVVRYLYQPGELEGEGKRAADPIWSLKVCHTEKTITKPKEPILVYLHDGRKCSFVHEELLVVRANTELPPLQNCSTASLGTGLL